MDCLVCGSDSVVKRIDFGNHPVASYFMSSPTENLQAYNLSLGQCSTCGTAQLVPPVSHDALIPPSWIASREPEAHLDVVVEKIISLPDVTSDSVIGALTYKDDTTVERFQKKGFNNTWRLKLKEDFEIHHHSANIETIQYKTTPERMRDVARKVGQADVLIVRHITEHAENPSSFLAGLNELLAPGGILMLEIPDCTTSLKLHEYCMMWEEHSLYLTPETFRNLPALVGLEVLCLDTYELPFENCLVLLARKNKDAHFTPNTIDVKKQIELVDRYVESYEPAKNNLRKQLETFRAVHGPIAIFGAGHIAHAFTNLMGISDLIEFVADDTPEKQGKFLSGSGLPIYPSSALCEQNIKLCLLALAIPSEDAVLSRNTAFIQAGGIFKSVFRASSRSVYNGI